MTVSDDRLGMLELVLVWAVIAFGVSVGLAWAVALSSVGATTNTAWAVAAVMFLLSLLGFAVYGRLRRRFVFNVRLREGRK